MLVVDEHSDANTGIGNVLTNTLFLRCDTFYI